MALHSQAKRYASRTLVFAALFGLPFVSACFAQNSQPEEADFPQSGLLAAVGSLSSRDLSMPLPVGMAPGKLPPISGSVNRGTKGTCEYSVTNNFDRPVRVNVSIRQYNATLKNIATSANSFRLKPQESQAAKVSERQDASGCALVMESWKFQG